MDTTIERRIAARWVDGFVTGDVEQLVGVFAEGASFWDPRFPVFAGLEKIRAYYEDMLATTADWRVVCSAPYILDDGAFALHTRSTFTARRLAKVIDLPLVAFFSHRDGLVHRYEEYWDTASMLTQLGTPFRAAPAPLRGIDAQRRSVSHTVAAPDQPSTGAHIGTVTRH